MGPQRRDGCVGVTHLPCLGTGYLVSAPGRNIKDIPLHLSQSLEKAKAASRGCSSTEPPHSGIRETHSLTVKSAPYPLTLMPNCHQHAPRQPSAPHRELPAELWGGDLVKK